MITLAGWQQAWHEAGAPRGGDESLFGQLVRRWSEPHRHYHTLQHLRECLAHFETARDLAEHPGEVALALWFHDAVYDPRREDNEQLSAEWAMEAALGAGLPEPAAQRLYGLVVATRHVEAPRGSDAQLLVDIDLAILGASPERFDESDAQIREEYAHVPPAQFKAGRRRVLQAFVDRPTIYSTPGFQAAFETQARSNLARALERLDGS